MEQLTPVKASQLDIESYRLFIESVTDYAIILLDPAGKVLSWNSGARRIKGYEDSEVIGRDFSLFYTPEDIAKGRPGELLGQARAQGSVQCQGWRLRSDGTKFWASVTITAFYDDRGELKGYGKVTQDLTKQVEAEQHLRKAYDALEQTLQETSRINQEMRELNVSMAGREYKIRDLENENKLLKLRLDMSEYLQPDL